MKVSKLIKKIEENDLVWVESDIFQPFELKGRASWYFPTQVFTHENATCVIVPADTFKKARIIWGFYKHFRVRAAL